MAESEEPKQHGPSDEAFLAKEPPPFLPAAELGLLLSERVLHKSRRNGELRKKGDSLTFQVALSRSSLCTITAELTQRLVSCRSNPV